MCNKTEDAPIILVTAVPTTIALSNGMYISTNTVLRGPQSALSTCLRVPLGSRVD